jgi:hypothetical protein
MNSEYRIGLILAKCKPARQYLPAVDPALSMARVLAQQDYACEHKPKKATDSTAFGHKLRPLRISFLY